MTTEMIKWNNFYRERDEHIRRERRDRCLCIGEACTTANAIYRRERQGGNLKHLETVARHILDDAASDTFLILDSDLEGLFQLIDWYCHRVNHIPKSIVPLFDYLNAIEPLHCLDDFIIQR